MVLMTRLPLPIASAVTTGLVFMCTYVFDMLFFNSPLNFIHLIGGLTIIAGIGIISLS
jgi:multidrug transporter EmrE-like cation transporter